MITNNMSLNIKIIIQGFLVIFVSFLLIGCQKGNGDIIYTNKAQNEKSTDQTIRVDYIITESTVWSGVNNILELFWHVAQIHKTSQNVIVTIYTDKKAIGLVDAYGKIIDETERIEQISENLNEIRKFNSLDDLQYGSFEGQLKFTEVANTIVTGRKRWFLDGEKYGLW